VPGLSANDVLDAARLFDRLRRDARARSSWQGAAFRLREARALVTTAVRERQARREFARATPRDITRFSLEVSMLLVRQVWRHLRRDAFYASLAALTMTLAIAGTSAAFAMVYAVVLHPLPYPDADRLVVVAEERQGDGQALSVSVPDYFDRRGDVDAFDESALYGYESLNLTGSGGGSADGGAPERVIGLRATASLFPLLSARAEMGRVFGEDEDRPGHERVVVLSDTLWHRAFGGDPSVVGRDIRLDGEPHRVLGVMPAGFEFPSDRVDLWTPFAPTPEQMSDDSRGFERWRMVARLAPGASLERAQQTGATAKGQISIGSTPL
jgi:putative ABC transport system permease protein